MNSDFSQLNLEYLIRARDLAIANQRQAGAILGIPNILVGMLPELTPKMLANITRIQQPLITPRQDIWWWSRLLIALRDGQPEEIETVMEQASMILATAVEKSKR